MHLFSDPRLYTPDFLEADWASRLLRPEIEALADRANSTPEERTRLDIVLSKIEHTGPDLREYLEEETKEAVEDATEDLQNKLKDALHAVEVVETQAKRARTEAFSVVQSAFPKHGASTIDIKALPEPAQTRAQKIAADSRKRYAYSGGPDTILFCPTQKKVQAFSLAQLIEPSIAARLSEGTLRVVRGYKC